MATPTALEKAHEPKDADLATAARGVWLVKVPKYLSEKWTEAGDTREVGKLRINKPKIVGGKPEVVFSLSDELTGPSKTGDGTRVPKEHKFVMTGITSQQLSVLAQYPNQEGITLPSGEPLYDKVAIEGKVIQRAECRPTGDSSYMKLKRVHMERDNQPTREVKRLDHIVNTYKPVSSHSFNTNQEMKKREEGKRARLDKDKVQEMLFAAFEKHQYYNVKDLVRITDQPITYLKEILKEICTYNMKAPHRNMWELKPEYRHYKEDEAS